jgi:hypothetical protein
MEQAIRVWQRMARYIVAHMKHGFYQRLLQQHLLQQQQTQIDA